ncbi:MAG: porin family protein [Cytophagales bacterium]|nr:porin family protein [Cytophagales bacterium]
MKKRIFILFLSVAAMTTICNAQESNEDLRSKFTSGLKVGFNLSNVYDSEGQGFQTDAKIGFAGGVFLSIPLSTIVGIQPEILFSQKGFQGSGTLLGSPYSFMRTTNYLDVPLLFALKPSQKITFLLGPQFSFLLNQKDNYDIGDISVQQILEFEKDNIRRNTLCFLGGIDFNFDHLTVGTRVGWDLQNNNGDGTSQTPRYKNTWLQATLGYRF